MVMGKRIAEQSAGSQRKQHIPFKLASNGCNGMLGCR
jgi:hypothetical protein